MFLDAGSTPAISTNHTKVVLKGLIMSPFLLPEITQKSISYCIFSIAILF